MKSKKMLSRSLVIAMLINLLGTIVCFNVQPVFAEPAYLINDNFDTSETGTSPSDPRLGYTVTVQDAVYGSSIRIAEVPSSTDKSICFDSKSKTDNTLKIYKTYTPQKGVFTAEVSFMQHTKGGRIFIRLLRGTAYGIVFTTDNGNINYRPGLNGEQIPLVSNFQVDTWYHIKAAVDIAQQKAWIYLDGAPVPALQGVGFYNGAAYSQFDGIDSYTYNAINSYYLDNIKVYPGWEAPAPTGVSASAGSKSVGLSWNAVEGPAVTYNVYMSSDNGTTYQKIAENIVGTSYDVTGLTNGENYLFMVSASVQGLEGAKSDPAGAAPVLAIPGQPAGLVAVAGDEQVILSWEPMPDADTYSVKRGTSPAGPFDMVAENITGSTYTCTGLTNGTTYYFTVSAANLAGEGPNSEVASAVPAVIIPEAPAGLAAERGDSEVELTWAPSSAAQYYTVKESETEGGPYRVIAENITDTVYTCTGLANGTEYYFVVSASNTRGESQNSVQVNAKPVHPYEVNISNLQTYAETTNAVPYAVGTDLQAGNTVYADTGDYVFTDVGPYDGMKYILTSNINRGEAAYPALTFDIDRDSTVYVVQGGLPSRFNDEYWLSQAYGWNFIGSAVTYETRDTAGNAVVYNPSVYARTFKAGKVNLGGNNGIGLMSGTSLQYSVFIGPPTGIPQDNPPAPPAVVPGTIPAFPGAEGGGMWATGGRGGEVYEVTNLEDYDPFTEAPIPGSFRDAVSRGNRTVVFRVAGTISLKNSLTIGASNLTIAGQTAPGDGITFKDNTVYCSSNNLILRFLRFRVGDDNGKATDSFGGRYRKQIIIDHVTSSWASDEVLSFYQNTDFTLQWSMAAESLMKSVNEKGTHGYGGIWGGVNSTFHHNLLAHNSSRNPRFSGGTIDYRNNVIYDWGYKSMYGDCDQANMINNYYRYGISTGPAYRTKIAEVNMVSGGTAPTYMYINGNYVYGFPEVTANNGLGIKVSSGAYLSPSEFQAANPVMTYTAEEAYSQVINYAGAKVPNRDSVDNRIINDVINGTGNIIYTKDPSSEEEAAELAEFNAQKVVLEWPVLNPGIAPVDSDHDGMPDSWEIVHGLNPNNPEDRNGDFSGDGYTNLEKYLNELTIPAFPEGVVPRYDTPTPILAVPF